MDASTRSLSELPRFFKRFKHIRGEFVIYDDGFRGWTFTYSEIARLAESFAARLRSLEIRKGMRRLSPPVRQTLPARSSGALSSSWFT